MKKITEISAQKNNAKRCNLYLDGEFFCGIELWTVMKNRLKAGMEISEEQLNEIVLENETETAMQKALSLVGRSMHTKAQVIKYLKNKGFLPQIIAVVVKKLEEYGYIDDKAFAKSYFEQKKNSKGKKLLSYELKMKGIDESVIDSALCGASSDDEGAYLVAQKFFSGKTIDFETIGKCYRRLVSKGFDYDTAKSVVERIKRENESFED